MLQYQRKSSRKLIEAILLRKLIQKHLKHLHLKIFLLVKIFINLNSKIRSHYFLHKSIELKGIYQCTIHLLMIWKKAKQSNCNQSTKETNWSYVCAEDNNWNSSYFVETSLNKAENYLLRNTNKYPFQTNKNLTATENSSETLYQPHTEPILGSSASL